MGSPWLVVRVHSDTDPVSETVRLPKGDPEAIKYLAQQAAEAKPQETAPTPQAAETSAAAPEPTATTISSADASIAPSTAIAAPIAAPPRRGPPMRKRPRQSLEAMAAAIDKGKKMTTLEKVRPAYIHSFLKLTIASHKWTGTRTWPPRPSSRTRWRSTGEAEDTSRSRRSLNA